jgi:hypothetical protein
MTRLVQASLLLCRLTAVIVCFLPSQLGAQTTSPRLAWDQAPSGATGYAVTIDGVRVDYGLTPVASDGTCGCSVELVLSPGTHVLVVSAYNSVGETGSSPLTVDWGGGGGLPSPWQNGDVGTPGIAGSASFADGVFTVNGSGADIWHTADAFHYAYQSLAGNGEIDARVTSIQNTDPFAKAGLMLRETMAADAVHVTLNVLPDGTVEFLTRSTTGGETTYVNGSAEATPVWLALVRTGSTITGYVSPDGIGWTPVGSTDVTMSSALIGLIVTSHDDAQVNTSTFDNVAVSP